MNRREKEPFTFISSVPRWVVVAGLYIITAILGLQVAEKPGYATAIWPPSGIALGAVLLWGNRVWPGIWLGSFIANSWVSSGGWMPASWTAAVVVAAIAAGSTLQPLAGAFVIEKWIVSKNIFGRPIFVFRFAACAILCCLIASTAGVSSLYAAGYIPASFYARNWFVWWLGDLTGILIFTPLWAVWSEWTLRIFDIRLRWTQAAEAFLSITAAGVLGWAIFGGELVWSRAHYPIAFLLLPFFLWSAFRYGLFGHTLVMLGIAGLALWGTVRGFGPFARENLQESLLLLQGFTAVISLAGLSLAAALKEIFKSTDGLRRAHDEMETRVQERTRELRGSNIRLQEKMSECKEAYEQVWRQQKFNDQLLRALSAAGEGVALMDARLHRFLFVNEAFARIFGYEISEVMDLTSGLDLVAPAEIHHLREHLQNPSQSHRYPDFYEACVTKKNGESVFVEFVIDLVQDSGQDRLLVAARDVSEKAAFLQAKEQRANQLILEGEQRYQGLVELCPDGILVHSDEKIVYINEAGAKLFGAQSAAELMGRDAMEFIDPDYVEVAKKRREQLISGRKQTLPLEYRVRRLDGQVIYVEASSIPIDYQGRPAFQSVMRDTTERRVFQENLHKAKEEAEAASHAKSRFLANMSHELRTPLNSVIGFSRLLLKKKDGGVSQTKIFLKRIMVNGMHLLNLINDILDLAKVESGQFELEFNEVDLKELVRETIGQLEGSLEGREVKLASEIPKGLRTLRADRKRLKQVLINLAGNAIKFTDQGRITIRVAQDPRTKIPVSMEVEDTGVGIPPEHMEKIFQPFWQADASDARARHGSGLGLAICRQFCQAMGYSMEADSAPGRGTTMRIVFSAADFNEALMLIESRLKELKRSDLAAGVLELFFKFMPGRIKTLVQSCEMKNRPVLKRTAHSIKGSAGNLGAVRLQKLADELEEAADLAPEEELRRLMENVKSEYGRVFHLASCLRENWGGGEKMRGSRPAARAGWRQLRAAVVEDNPDNRLVLQALLEKEMSLDLYDDGLKALNGLKRRAPDLIILDISLPGMDGLEVLKRIREDAKLKSLPVVALTAHAMVEDREKYLRAGFDDYLSKPIVDEELVLATVRRWLGRKAGAGVSGEPEAPDEP